MISQRASKWGQTKVHTSQAPLPTIKKEPINAISPQSQPSASPKFTIRILPDPHLTCRPPFTIRILTPCTPCPTTIDQPRTRVCPASPPSRVGEDRSCYTPTGTPSVAPPSPPSRVWEDRSCCTPTGTPRGLVDWAVSFLRALKSVVHTSAGPITSPLVQAAHAHWRAIPPIA